MPVWLLRLAWATRRKRAVILLMKPIEGSATSIEGVLVGRWSRSYILLAPSMLMGPEETLPLGGSLEVPRENVLAVQYV